jgi:hypothetical protein
MPYGRSWRSGRRLETPGHLSADRLADMHTLRLTASESAANRLFRGAPEQTLVDRPSRPSGLPGKKHGDEPVPVVPSPAIAASAVAPATDWKSGRHRRPSSPRFTVWGFALTFRRVALMGALVLLVVASSVLFVLS